MISKDELKDLHVAITELEDSGHIKEANTLHTVFVRVASQAFINAPRISQLDAAATYLGANRQKMSERSLVDTLSRLGFDIIKAPSGHLKISYPSILPRQILTVSTHTDARVHYNGVQDIIKLINNIKNILLDKEEEEKSQSHAIEDQIQKAKNAGDWKLVNQLYNQM